MWKILFKISRFSCWDILFCITFSWSSAAVSTLYIIYTNIIQTLQCVEWAQDHYTAIHTVIVHWPLMGGQLHFDTGPWRVWVVWTSLWQIQIVIYVGKKYRNGHLVSVATLPCELDSHHKHNIRVSDAKLLSDPNFDIIYHHRLSSIWMS